MRYKDLGDDWFPVQRCVVCGGKARRATIVSEGCGSDRLAAICGPACGKKFEDDPAKYPVPKSQWD